MSRSYGGYCDGCHCGFSLTSALHFWHDMLLCEECEEVADHIGAGRVQRRLDDWGAIRRAPEAA